MATVGIWKISSNLKRVIEYATDLNKIKDSTSSEIKYYVDGINIDVNNAYKEMLHTKKRFSKEDGILAFHSYHSYKKDEVSPEVAHKIGVQLANEMWGDKFQVIVCTHLDSNCIHNHFVINSVSYIDGKKYYDNRRNYAELRRLSNIICSEYGLSTLNEKTTKAGINYLNYQIKETEFSNYYKKAKKDIDMSIAKAKTFNEFISILESLNYEVKNRSGKLSVRNLNYKRNIRIERYFGDNYSIKNIEKRIKELYSTVRTTKYNKNTKSFWEVFLSPKYNSFYGNFCRYSLILKNYSLFYKNKNITRNMKNDLNKLEELNSQTRLLVKNDIKSEEEFKKFYDDLIFKFVELDNIREDLWKKVKVDNSIDIKKEIAEIKNNLKKIKSEIRICEGINKRKNIISIEINEFKDKEMMSNEYIR